MAQEIISMPAGDSLRIKFSMTEDRVVVSLDGYTITVTVATTPTPTAVSMSGSGAYTVITIPRGSITTVGMYDADIVADNGTYRDTKPFRLRVDAHP